ncbi:MAG: hypothetical protein GX271_11725, partial [Clostridiales bacterium]|nr:hypothetical protein [Clostridiales bacterium]
MKKITSILLIIIISLSACSSSKSVNDRDTVLSQVLKDRESSADTKSISNTEKINSGADSDSSNEDDNTVPSSWFELEQLGPIGYVRRSYGEVKEQYPDKTILTVAGVFPSDFITDSINEYLTQNGTEYVVFFTELTMENSKVFENIDELNSKQYEEKKQAVNNLIDTVDIIPMGRKMYYEFAREGRFEPWSSYLSTEEGMKLYMSLPENNWKTCIMDDEIYGINGRADLVFGPPSYIINKEIMDKYNLMEEDLNKPIYELEAILKMVAEGEKANPDFKPLAIDYAEWFNVFDNSVYLNSKSVALYNDTTKKAGSVLDELENLRWLKTLCQYANQGLIDKTSKRLNNFFLKVNIRSSLPYMIPDYMFLYNKDGELSGADDVTEIVLDKYYDGCLCWIGLTSIYANCIPVSSKYKDDAFDFIMRLYTDSYLTNLLTYGLENKTYIIKEGKVDWPDIYYPEYGNTYISYSRSYEYADKKERYWKLNEELAYVYYDFIFDPTNVKDELEKT